MSNDDFTLQAQARGVAGKGASRRLRRLEGNLPAIVYGEGKDSQSISVEHKELVKRLENEAFYSSIIALNIDGKTESVVLKDLQRHPARKIILHADFMRISKDRAIRVNVPLHLLNGATSKGVKLGGGIIAHTLTQLEVSCLPADLPEAIEVDLADVDVGETLHISDLKLPAGVESVALGHGPDYDLPVVTINKPKGGDTDEDEEETPEEGTS